MRLSQQKSNRWLYIVLVLALLTSVAALALPLLDKFIERSSSSQTRTSILGQANELEVEPQIYELAVRREPDNPRAWRDLLEVRLNQQDLPGAIEALEQLAQLKPEQVDYQILLAQAKQQVGDYEEAAQAYRTVLATNPTNIYALQGLVNLLLQQNRPEAAVGLLQDTLKAATQANSVQPNIVEVVPVQLLLGQVYAQQNRYAEAIAVYNQAIDTDQEDFRPVLAKALILKEQGKYDEVKPLLTTALSLAPSRYKDSIQQIASNLPESSNNEVQTQEAQ